MCVHFKIRRLLAMFFLLSVQPLAFADSAYNLTKGVTEISKDVYHLHMTIFAICVVIAILVFGVMFYALLKHRRSRGHEAANFHESTKVEIIWTIIPFVILIVMAIPATHVLIKMNDTTDSDMTIQVTGYQWKWKYDYRDEGVSFFSNLATSQEEIQNLAPKGDFYLREVDNRLVLPVGKKIRFLFEEIVRANKVSDWNVLKVFFSKRNKVM